MTVSNGHAECSDSHIYIDSNAPDGPRPIIGPFDTVGLGVNRSRYSIVLCILATYLHTLAWTMVYRLVFGDTLSPLSDVVSGLIWILSWSRFDVTESNECP